MRIASAVLIIIAIATSVSARAGSDLTAFPLSNEECVAVGDITLGTHGRWAHCSITRNGWFATIDKLDLYQSQYCLGSKAGVCEQRALLLFANRAYTPDAKLLLQRVDSGSTAYDDPLTVNTENSVIMMLAKRIDGVSSSSYYYWKTNQWLPIEAQAWQRQLPKYLPKNVGVRDKALLDIGTMSAQAKLYRTKDADCCPGGGVADVNLVLSKGRFVVKSVEVLPNAK